MNNIIKVGMNLTVYCLLAALVIAGTYSLTAPKALVERERLKNEAMHELVADASNFQPVEDKTGWFKAIKQDKTAAYIVPVETKGYGGKIKMLVAVSADGLVIDYKILAHNETPGLGDNALKANFRKQFMQKKYDELILTKAGEEGKIQAIAGATITSRGVTNGVKDAVEQVNRYLSSKNR